MLKRLPAALICLAAALALAPIAPSHAEQGKKTVVRVKGSYPMASVVDKLAKLYMAEHPDCSIVVSGGGTAHGLAEVISGNAEVAMASRPPKEEAKTAKAKGVALEEKIIGWDGVAVIGHPSNPVDEISFDQIRAAYSGAVSDWRELGGKSLPIKAFTADGAKAAYSAFFKDYVLKNAPERQDVLVRRYFPTIIKEVSQSPEAIAYAPLRMVVEAEFQGTVKAFAVKKKEGSPAVEPTMDALAMRSYPLILPLFLCYDRETKAGHVKQFVDFCFTKGGMAR